MAPQQEHRGDQLALLLPGQIAHRNTRKTGQALDDGRVSGNAAAVALPDLRIGVGIDLAPAALTPAFQKLQHQAPCSSDTSSWNCVA